MIKIEIKSHEFVAFMGLWLWLGIYNVLQEENHTWLFYLLSLAILIPTQLPGLVFSFFRARFRTTLTNQTYLLYWTVCFVIGLPTLTTICILIAQNAFDWMFLIAAALFNFALELVLVLNHLYQKRIRNTKWIKKLGLENSIFITVILIALTVSIMAVSSLNIPEYDKKDQLLIGFEFSITKIIKNFWTFLGFFSQFLIIYLSGYLLFFINSRLLVSQVLKQRGLLLYILCLLSTAGFLYPLLGQLLALLPINQVFGRDIFSLNPFNIENAFGAISIMLLSLPIVLSLQWANQNSKILSLEKDKSQTELDLLKQQLNPHFFFNTLNNLYSLSLQQSEKTSDSILRLAELMRYTIYKGQQERVNLLQELNYIEDYIQLQQIRLKKPLKFNFEKLIGDENLQIAPLLLIVLIENAFKHGIEPAENEASLSLYLRSDQKKLYFTCENSIEEVDHSQFSGIGLSNLKKRLALLYPNKHLLKITQSENQYTAQLEIIL